MVFTGGIGENDAWVRRQVTHEMDNLGLVIDDDKNQQDSTDSFAVHLDGSRVAILVVPTNEELEIALQTLDCLQPGS